MAFQIRLATVEDAIFIVGASDSIIQVLIVAGNVGQCGAELFSHKDGFTDSTRDDLAQSEHFCKTGKGERIRTCIAKMNEPSAPAAFLTIPERRFSQHVPSLGTLQPYVDKAESLPGGYSYIYVLNAEPHFKRVLRFS